MSYMIEYQAECFVLPAGLLGLKQSKFVIATERGSNNLTQRARNGSERRVRDWGIAMLGSADQVMRQVVATASSCEGGGLKVGGRTTTPEAYIRRARRLLAEPRADAIDHITLHATVKVGHALVPRAKLFGLAERLQRSWGEDESVLSPPRSEEGLDWGAFFRAIDPFLEEDSLSPHRLGDVWGLPTS